MKFWNTRISDNPLKLKVINLKATWLSEITEHHKVSIAEKTYFKRHIFIKISTGD